MSMLPVRSQSKDLIVALRLQGQSLPAFAQDAARLRQVWSNLQLVAAAARFESLEAGLLVSEWQQRRPDRVALVSPQTLGAVL